MTLAAEETVVEHVEQEGTRNSLGVTLNKRSMKQMSTSGISGLITFSLEVRTPEDYFGRAALTDTLSLVWGLKRASGVLFWYIKSHDSGQCRWLGGPERSWRGRSEIKMQRDMCVRAGNGGGGKLHCKDFTVYTRWSSGYEIKHDQVAEYEWAHHAVYVICDDHRLVICG